MKRSKKIWISSLSILGIASLVAVGCTLGLNNTITSNQVNTSQNPKSIVNNDHLNALKKTKTTFSNVLKTDNNSNLANVHAISNPNITTHYHTTSATLVSNNDNSTFTYPCTNGNVLLFSINSNQQGLTLLGFSNKQVNPNLIIPNVIIHGNNFYCVTNIASGAFYGQGLGSVTFNDNLVSIGALAFANNNLTKLSFPSSLQSIGNNAFISNQFPHAYAVYLPVNTMWSKNWLTCPFGNLNNLNKLVNGIQFVIQGTAVYEFQPNQNAWVIVSYNITTGNANNPVWSTLPSNNSGWSTNPNTYYIQSSYNFTMAQQISTPINNALHTTLNDFALYTSIGEGYCQQMNWIFYFNANKHQMIVDTTTNNGQPIPIFGDGVSSTFSISLYDPFSSQYIINWQNLGANTSSTPNGKTVFTYQEGDILSFKVNNSQMDAAVFIASDFDASYVSSNGSCSLILNDYINPLYSWTIMF